MGQKSIAIVVAWTLFACALSLTVPTDETQAAQVEDILGKDLKWSLPGGQAVHNIYVMVGDNVTLTFWNYTGPEGRATVMYYASSDYYERSDNFLTNLYTEFNIVTGRTYVFWAIVPITGSMSITFDMYDDGTPLSVEYRITREISGYTPDYYIRPVVDEMTEDLRQNVTDLQDTTAEFQGETEALDARVDQMSNEIAGLQQSFFVLNGSIGALDGDLGNLRLGFSSLTGAFMELNHTVTGILSYLNDLGLGEVELPWLEENLTDLRGEMGDILTQLDAMRSHDDDILALTDRVDDLAEQMGRLNSDLTDVRDSIPAAFDDTALRERIAQLEGQNELLQMQIDDLEDEQDELKTAPSSPAIGYIALAIGLVALAIGAAALLMKRAPRGEGWIEEK